MAGPSSTPRPIYEPSFDIAMASSGPDAQSEIAAEVVVEPERVVSASSSVRRTQKAQKLEGKRAIVAFETMLKSGPMRRNALRPYVSLRPPIEGFMRNWSSPPAVLVVASSRMEAETSPRQRSSTICGSPWMFWHALKTLANMWMYSRWMFFAFVAASSGAGLGADAIPPPPTRTPSLTPQSE